MRNKESHMEKHMEHGFEKSKELGIRPITEGTKPITRGVKPISGSQAPKPPQGGTGQSNKTK